MHILDGQDQRILSCQGGNQFGDGSMKSATECFWLEVAHLIVDRDTQQLLQEDCIPREASRGQLIRQPLACF